MSFYLGRISYSVYLFHIVIIMALKPLVGAWPLVLQLALYVAAILRASRPSSGAASSGRSWRRGRLRRRAPQTAAAPAARPRSSRRRRPRSLTASRSALRRLAAAALARNAFMANKPYAVLSGR